MSSGMLLNIQIEWDGLNQKKMKHQTIRKKQCNNCMLALKEIYRKKLQLDNSIELTGKERMHKTT